MNQLKGDGITVTSEYSGMLTVVNNCKIETYLRRVHKQPARIKSIWTEVNLPSEVDDMILRRDFGVKGFVDCIVETETNGIL